MDAEGKMKIQAIKYQGQRNKVHTLFHNQIKV
jgi:hypothetical protein